MEANIKHIDRREDNERGGILVTATLVCRKCGKDYQITFRESAADIVHRYHAETISKQYIERCAPVLCGDCLVFKSLDLSSEL